MQQPFHFYFLFDDVDVKIIVSNWVLFNFDSSNTKTIANNCFVSFDDFDAKNIVLICYSLY